MPGVWLIHSDSLGVPAATEVLQEIEGDQMKWIGNNKHNFGVVMTPIHEEFIQEPLDGDDRENRV